MGPLQIQRARSLNEAQDFLTALAELHQVYWTGRGKIGAFANGSFERFHRTLLSRGFRQGQIDLLKITAGTTVIGYLYNLPFRGHIYAYQSGFNYRLTAPTKSRDLPATIAQSNCISQKAPNDTISSVEVISTR